LHSSLAAVVLGALLFARVVSADLQLSALHGAQKNVRYIVRADRVFVDSAA